MDRRAPRGSSRETPSRCVFGDVRPRGAPCDARELRARSTRTTTVRWIGPRRGRFRLSLRPATSRKPPKPRRPSPVVAPAQLRSWCARGRARATRRRRLSGGRRGGGGGRCSHASCRHIQRRRRREAGDGGRQLFVRERDGPAPTVVFGDDATGGDVAIVRGGGAGRAGRGGGRRSRSCGACSGARTCCCPRARGRTRELSAATAAPPSTSRERRAYVRRFLPQ